MRRGSVETYEFLRCHCDGCESCSSGGCVEAKVAGERRFMRYVKKSPSVVVDLVIDGVRGKAGQMVVSLRLGDILLFLSRTRNACAGFSSW